MNSGVNSDARPPQAVRWFIDGKDVGSCPVCGRVFAMQQSFAGKTIRCRGCRNPFMVEPAGTADPSAGRPMSGGADRDLKEPHRPLVMPPPPMVRDRPDAGAEPISHEAAAPAASDDIGDEMEFVDPAEPCPVATAAGSYRQAVGSGAGEGLAALAAVVLGGLTALPATLLILWWVVGKDPLHIAPLLPESVKWLAPDHLGK